MFGFLDRLRGGSNGESVMPPGEDVSMGCEHHHFEDYEEQGQFRASVKTQTRHFDPDYRDVGEWCDADWRTVLGVRGSTIDVRRLVVVEQAHEAVCEHTGCSERDIEWREYETFVFDEDIQSTAEDREAVGDTDD